MTIEQTVLPQFQASGSDLFQRGLVTTHSGNLSIKKRGRVFITRHGCMLGRLTAGDVAETELLKEEPVDAAASMDLAVHRAVYGLSSAQAIVHAHPAHASALSLTTEKIVPADVEGTVLLGSVPVVGKGKDVGPGKGAEAIAKAFRDHNVVMARGHGCFAVGESLREACHRAMILEESSRVLFLLKALGQ